MATHSGVLAWRTPRTEEPGGLQSMGSHTESEATDTARHGADFWMSRISGGALVSQGCHNKIPQSWWLAQEKCIVSQF